MKNEAKVGVVVLIGLLVLMGIVSFLGMFKFAADNYDIYISFRRTTGLKPGDIVNYVGVPVGQVDKIEVYGHRVRVTASLKNDIKIPQGSMFLLGSEGVMGAMYIDIEPPNNSEFDNLYIEPGEEVIGMSGSSLNDFMSSAAGVLSKLEVMADAVNTVFADQDIQRSIKETIVNTDEITKNISDLSRVFAEVAVSNQGELNNMIGQFSSMALQMNQLANRMNKMLSEIDNEGQAGQDISTILQNLNQASENVARITKSIEGFTSDEKTQEDLRETLKNAREASEKTNRMLSNFGGGSKKVSLDLKYGDRPDKYRADANLKFNYSAKSFLVLGVSGIGEENDLNLQLGRGNEKAALRAGIVLGKLGTGIDYVPLKWLKLSADAYDPNDFKVRLGGEIMLTEKLSLVGESLDVRKKASDTTYVGIRGYF